MLSFGFCLPTIGPTPALSPKFGQLLQLFSHVEIKDFKVNLGLEIPYVLYNIYYNTIYIQPKKLGRTLPPPSFGQNPTKCILFSQETVPYFDKKKKREISCILAQNSTFRIIFT